MTAKVLEAALSKVTALPEAAQEQIGRELLAHVEALEALRSELEIGVAQLDAGLGEPLDIDEMIGDARREHAEK